MSFGERITPHFRVSSRKGQVRVKTSGGGNVLTYLLKMKENIRIEIWSEKEN